jgi:hypothetical protein
VPSASARPNGLGTLGGWERAARELGRVRKPGTGDRKLEKDAEGRGRSRGGRAVFMVVEQSGKARAYARSPIRGPLNSGVQTGVLR